MGYIEALNAPSRDAPVVDSPSVFYSVAPATRTGHVRGTRREIIMPPASPVPIQDRGSPERRVTFNSMVEVLRTPTSGLPPVSFAADDDDDDDVSPLSQPELPARPASPSSGAASISASDSSPDVPRPSVASKPSPHLLNFVREMMQESDGVAVRDRVVYQTSTNYSSLHGVFTGEDAVSWVVEHKQMAEREHALKVLSRLATTGVFRRVDKRVQELSLDAEDADDDDRAVLVEDTPEAWYQFAIDES
jgi:Domain found in Dishevelled, Egl-10, and Pleckstrin (DEP)